MKIVRILVGLSLLGTGIYMMSHVAFLGIFNNLTLFVATLIATPLMLGWKGFKQLFRKPEKPIKWFLIFLIANIIWSFGVGILEQAVYGSATSNPATGQFYIFFFLPFMLLGEELFSISILEWLRKWIPDWTAILISALVFGLVHFWTYSNGDIIQTLLHILLIQGVARIWLNFAYLKSGSIWVSLAVHIAFDLLSLGLGFLLS
ncbi:hypothetical protein MFLO_00570 [Listeria floridensis FSL S10-1187]|uniref:CAAX prenyl protease 2/Lysostaphin resistance protein A-like domain-containing protein n=1 Tax=Listeria floridensis FSL S10-1187 TaxID=1265817 RepID=A0ABP3B173_9LIST|nr:CPBP family intramembrane glutamic endopeptidase [Listeria floridensis]EUJ33696.1 hypothetical protein MFLO_00570 [Listeria floridensis FSL S10-1187]